jgi:putative transport protein
MVQQLADHPVALVFVVLAVGSLVGAVRVKGVSLGPAGALFAGLALSAIDQRMAIPDVVGNVGLALFTYTIGLASGPSFFSSLRSQVRTLVLIVAALVVGAGVAGGIGRALGLDRGLRAGLFTGALTNTPALAAAREALGGSSRPVVGYSVAYPIGVIVMMVATWWVLRRVRTKPNDDDRWRPASLTTATIEVDRDAVVVGDIAERVGGIVFSRLQRGGQQSVPGQYTVLARGDRISLTGAPGAVIRAVEMLGARVEERITDDRSQLDVRRIVLSNRALSGRTLGELDLHGRFGAVATRVRRGDVDLLADDAFVVLPGDRVRVVAPPEQLRAIAELLGDSERRIGEVDSLGFTAGLAIGLLIGLISIPLPGGSHFSLGGAGGPLLVGLVLGRLERTGPLLWQAPYGANLALRQIGTALFLGTVGSRSGKALADALGSFTGVKLAVGAAAVAVATAAVLLAGGRRLAALGGARLAGLAAGTETQPAVLAFASERSDDERISIAYALAFPVAMIAKIVLVQVLAHW